MKILQVLTTLAVVLPGIDARNCDPWTEFYGGSTLLRIGKLIDAL